MSGWSDIAYRAALTNPDIVVVDDSTVIKGDKIILQKPEHSRLVHLLERIRLPFFSNHRAY